LLSDSGVLDLPVFIGDSAWEYFIKVKAEFETNEELKIHNVE